MNIYLAIYFIINAILFGGYCQNFFIDEGRWDSARSWLGAILTAALGVPILIGIVLYWFVYQIIWETILNGYFQLGFFLTFLFTKQWHNVDKDKLEEINEMMKEGKTQKTGLAKTLLYYGVRLINKRNNYKN